MGDESGGPEFGICNGLSRLHAREWSRCTERLSQSLCLVSVGRQQWCEFLSDRLGANEPLRIAASNASWPLGEIARADIQRRARGTRQAVRFHEAGIPDR